MSGQRWDEVQALFRAALERDIAQRDAFLRDASGGDESLRAEVASLLEHHAASSSFIEHPLAPRRVGVRNGIATPTTVEESPAGQPLTPPPGKGQQTLDTGGWRPGQVGGYTILRVLGEGGMGVVYAAEQRNPHRTVALKLIRPGMASAAVLRRFEHEAQVLGRLQHPGIAQIFEAGTFDAGHGPQPFFAMELVEGRPLLDHAAVHKLTTRDRLQLVIRICDAVQHAHQKGVIHRDLKPANILVADELQIADLPLTPVGGVKGGSAIPKILDFGVARATDADLAATTLHTAVGQLIGTVQYMSPEQVAGDPTQLDTRSDVYALGVITYELLTGRLPYDLSQKTIPDAVRIIGLQDPTPLSSVSRVFRGDLNTIVAKALEKDKAHRYASAAEFAADIERYLHDEPVAARPPTMGYQLRKFARRNKAFVGGLGLAVAALAIGATISIWQAVRATAEWKRAVSAEKIAQQRLSEREQEAVKVKEINRFLVDMLKAADPGAAPGREVTVREILDRSAARIDTAFSNQPEIEAALRTTMAQAYIGLGRDRDAAAQAQAALDIAEHTLGDADVRTLELKNILAAGLRGQGDYTASEQLFRTTLETSRAVLGPDHEMTLHAARGLANTLTAQSRLPEAETLFRELLPAMRRVFGADDVYAARTSAELARVVHERGDAAEAERLYREALDSFLRIQAPDHPDVLTVKKSLADALRQQRRLSETEALLRETLTAQRRVLGDDHADTLSSVNSLASTLADQERLSEAEPFFRQAVETSRRVLGDEHPDTLGALNNQAITLRRLGKLSEAELIYGTILDILRKTLGPQHLDTLTVMTNRATLLADLGALEQAEALCRESLAGFQQVLGPEHRTTLALRQRLAVLLMGRGQPGEAEALLRQALAAQSRLLGRDHPDTLFSMNDLGNALKSQGKLAEAEVVLREALETRRQALGEQHPETLVSMYNLAMLYKELGDLPLTPSPGVKGPAAAAALLRQAVQIANDALPPGHWRLGVYQAGLGACLIELGQFEEAETQLLASHSLLDRKLGAGHARTLDAVRDLIELYRTWDKPDEASRYGDLLAGTAVRPTTHGGQP